MTEDPNWWDGYEPEHGDEFDLCSACKASQPHSLEQHEKIVENTRNGANHEVQVWVPLHEESEGGYDGDFGFSHNHDWN